MKFTTYLKIGCVILLLVSVTLNVSLLSRLNRHVATWEETPLDPSLSSSIRVTKDRVVLKQVNKPTKSIPVPRSGEVKIETTKQGSVQIEEPGWMPALTLLPHLGVSYTLQHSMQPMLGLQLVRLEALRLGLSFNIAPYEASISLDKDIMTNGLIGITLSPGTVGFHFSLFF